MPQYDDQAFEAPQGRRLFCPECEQDRTPTDDDDRCPVCGTLLLDAGGRDDLISSFETFRQRILPIALGLPGPGSENLPEDLADPLGALSEVLTGGSVDQPAGERDFRTLLEEILRESEEAREGSRATAKATLEALPSLVVDGKSHILNEISLKVDGINGEVIALPANFGPPVPRTLKSSVIAANPLSGQGTLENAPFLENKIVVMDRGVVSFANKIQRAEAAGAVAVIICQNCDVWPYTMTDSKNEAKDLKIPAIMIRKEHGKRIKDLLGSASDNSTITATITSKSSELECVICQETFPIGCTVSHLPCQHHFHEDCVRSWLGRRNTCPICRYELPSDDPAYEQERRRRQSGQEVQESWTDIWVS